MIASTQMVRMADEQLQDPALEAAQRSLLVLLRQLSLECRQRGAEPAARLLGVRLIAGYALLADSPAAIRERPGKVFYHLQQT